jgi:hypothetical protein
VTNFGLGKSVPAALGFSFFFQPAQAPGAASAPQAW